MKLPKPIIFLIILSIALKLTFFISAALYAPEMKFQNDTKFYIQSGEMLVTEGYFGKINEHGQKEPMTIRTPGYPLFLGILHNTLNIPFNGILFIQILLSLLTVWVTYKTAQVIHPRLGLICILIILFDISTTMVSLMLLTESLFTLLLMSFVYQFCLFIKGKKTSSLILSALFLSLATYVRPITYFLGIAVSVFLLFMFFKTNIKKAFILSLTFLILVYSILGLWHIRNQHQTGRFIFSNIEDMTVNAEGLIHSYARNRDVQTQGMPPVPYYINVTGRCLLTLLTRAETIKQFDSKAVRVAGKVFAYPWIVFWLIGFIIGFTKMGSERSLNFLIFVIGYFICVTIVAAIWGDYPRFRVPMLPMIAILADFGWQCYREKKVIKKCMSLKTS